MTRRAVVLLVAVLAAAAYLAWRPNDTPSGASAAGPPRAAVRSGPASAGVEVDPAGIRDVFRYAEPPTLAPRPVAAPVVAALQAPAPAPEPYRLVGLVRRQGKRLAAFSFGGEVLLAGPGDAVGDATVLEVGEEGVRVRRRDGSEVLIPVP